MKQKSRTFQGRVTRQLLCAAVVLLLVVAAALWGLARKPVINLYVDNIHSQMLLNYQYTRRVMSDVYVQVTNNVPYIEQTLDNPEKLKSIVEQIVKNGNRVNSCDISFIEDYYPQLGHSYHAYAWRNIENQDSILVEAKANDERNYLDKRLFKNVVSSNSALWSDPFYSAYNDRLALAAYMVPIHDASGRTVAVLSANISLDWLTWKLDVAKNKYNNLVLLGRGGEIMTKSFIINHDGTFLTHPDERHQLGGVFYNYIKNNDESKLTLLFEGMKNGGVSSNEGAQKYVFNGEECYLFYKHMKYTDWMMVTVVPCKPIDMQGVAYVLNVLLITTLAMLLLVLIAYFIVKIQYQKR